MCDPIFGGNVPLSGPKYGEIKAKCGYLTCPNLGIWFLDVIPQIWGNQNQMWVFDMSKCENLGSKCDPPNLLKITPIVNFQM